MLEADFSEGKSFCVQILYDEDIWDVRNFLLKLVL